MPDKVVPSEVFKAMSARIERNDAAEFAGAYVIISPKGVVVSQAFVNPEGDEAAFWGFVSGAIQVAATESQQGDQSYGGISNRRR